MDIKQVLWPGWETTRLIGRGSFGAVYEIERRLFEDDEPEKAALKVISIPQNDSDIEEMYSDGYDEESVTSTFHTHLKSIVAEYSLMRKMNGSSNIVNCDDVRYVQHDDGIGWDIYIKMELLTPLAKALPATVSEEQVIKIAKDMCAALELCSKHNIIHRDIKPQNIFVSENGDYKLGDFGIAKTVEKTMGGTKTGTYKYMAPEVYSNRPYNSTADIYSLGLVLYWLLNERRMPFMPLPPEKLRAGMDEESRNRRFSGEKIPAPKNGSEKLKRIVLKACAFDPKERYQTAQEMREDILSCSNVRVAEFIPRAETDSDSRLQDDTDDNKTMGPIFNHTPVVDADDLDKTVGPVFDHNVADDLDKGNTIKPNTQNKKQKGNKTFGVVAALLAVGVLCSFLFFGKDTDKDTEPISVEQTTLGKEDRHTLPLIDSPIDISGSFTQGSHFVSYDPVSAYTFQIILDQNHRMYLINKGMDNSDGNIVCDTGINNVASAYVGYEYDPSYDCNIPKLYYLTTAKEIWTAKMIPGEKWEIQTPERYGEWADVREIYITSSILPGLVILKDNGDLYVGSQKIPVPNVVEVQCFFDSIMFRTDDGTFYVAGENSYGSFVETSADSIPFEQPERLLISTDADDACVVRAIINGQQNYRVATLEGGILSIQDKPGNYLVEGFGNVRAIEVADMALYIIHEDGTLYGFGTFSSGGQLTAAGLAEDDICRITEFDGMNKIMGLALHGWGCMAVDCDGTIRINTEGYSGPLYKENGEQFCFVNSKQNDSAENPLIWGLDMTLEEFERRSEQLLETASTWTMETAPQTLADFPFFPSSVFELFDTIKGAEEKITISDSKLIWESELPQILPKTNTGREYLRNFEYVDNNKNAWVRWPFEQTGNNKYAAQIPENVWGESNSNFELGVTGYNYYDEWQETLQISYPISSKQIDGASFIGLTMSNNQYSVAWYDYVQEGKINIDIYTWPDGRIWYMTYDAASGSLVNMSK